MADEILTQFNRLRFQTIAFLLVLPAVNWLFIVTTLYDMEIRAWGAYGTVALRLWLLFSLSYLVLRLLRRYAPAMFPHHHFWRQLAVHVTVVLSIAVAMGLLFGVPLFDEHPTSMLMPRVFLVLEIVVYVAMKWVSEQQALTFAISDRLKEAQLYALKSQSNPHFLFNTLNMISSEIESDPARAKESVFDLADLLRSNIRLAQQRTTPLHEELRLVSLYLGLQQRRFRNRLRFSMSIDPRTADFEVPALLLQPVIENTIKWAVAPYPDSATIAVVTQLHEGGSRWSVLIKDSGPPFDDANVRPGDGFRILYQTLELHYEGNYAVSLRSTPDGGVFSLELPTTVKEHVNA